MRAGLRRTLDRWNPRVGAPFRNPRVGAPFRNPRVGEPFHRAASRHDDRDAGQISLLILGFTAIALMLVLGAVDVTAAQLARARLLDAADGAALDAADALAEPAAYAGGLVDTVAISSASVQDAAAGYLSAQPLPGGITAWVLDAGTGSPDGRTSLVRLTGTADLPMSGVLMRAFGGSVTITVESRARATLQ